MDELDECEGGIKFVNCIGSDINLWKKESNDEDFQWETCLLYDEPEYHHHSPVEINTIWKFIDHITKKYLLGNGKKLFHYQKHEHPAIRVEITTPIYTLKELCTYTIATTLLLNGNVWAINNFEIPKELKNDLNNTAIDLEEIYENDGY